MTRTEQKIKEVKELIKNKVGLREIIKEKFGNSENRKTEWLNKNNSFFTGKELKYLEFIQDVEVIDVVDSEKVEEIVEEKFYPVEYKQKFEYLFNQENFEKLVRLLEGKEEKMNVRNNLVLESENLKVKFKESKISIKNIRVNSDIYDLFTEICKKNDLKIINGLNLAFYEFFEKYKD